MTRNTSPSFVLSLYPTSHGFAFVLFEGSDAPFDWGVKEVRAKRKNPKVLDDVKALIELYHPEVLVMEDTDKGKVRRAARIRRLYRMPRHLASTEEIDVASRARTYGPASRRSVPSRSMRSPRPSRRRFPLSRIAFRESASSG